jgi:hypothetical protein
VHAKKFSLRHEGPGHAQPPTRGDRVSGPCGLPAAGQAAGKRVRQELLRRVRSGDVAYARKLSHSRTVIVLVYAGEEMAFIYSNSGKGILCFLPPNAAETEDWRQSQAIARALFPRPEGGYC